MQPVTISVNGVQRQVLVDPRESLLQVLRDRLSLTGTKEGCGTGYCGACTVLVDDAPVNACLFFAVDADHREITTIEGLGEDGDLHPVQAAFVECTALQCGYCTPGMILSALALLRENPSPSEDEVRRGLAGNLCRCTGYQAIVAAVLSAAQAMGAADHPARSGRRSAMRSRA